MRELGSVFLSGPMSGIENYNVEAFARAHALLKEAGVVKVYNPAVAYLEDADTSRSHEEWLRRCINELTTSGFRMDGDNFVICRQYETLVSIPGWENSHGALVERKVAEAIGINVIDIEEVVDW